MSRREQLRVFARTLAVAALTAEHLALLEVERIGKGDAPSVVHRRIGRWAKSSLGACGVEVLAGGPKLGDGLAYPRCSEGGVGRMFIMNHRSALDILVVLSRLEACLVSRADLATWPFIGAAARRVGTLFVDRESAASGAKVVSQMSRALRDGRGIAIFPEGTAFPGDEVRPLRAGAFVAALRAGAEIVPVGLAYEDPRAAYGDESFGAHVARVLALGKVRVAVEAGEPIRSEGGVVEALRSGAKSELERLVARARKRLS
ncbi:MAG: 1-acyl-sn-glycerol-3-phosphate acyltransferase [Myxococcales bacterium]|nr:1-acyl-sn-glycerol-3-phosphate acyltransferase [Myxococcales bacterium]